MNKKISLYFCIVTFAVRKESARCDFSYIDELNKIRLIHLPGKIYTLCIGKDYASNFALCDTGLWPQFF